jgi:predicted O-methyltransferase YrrM
VTSVSAPVRVEEMSRIKRHTLWSLLLHGHFPTEGSSNSEQLLYLASETRRAGARRVAEIGFNIGLSSRALLRADPRVRLVRSIWASIVRCRWPSG